MIAIDPGSEESAFVEFAPTDCGPAVLRFGKVANLELLLELQSDVPDLGRGYHMPIEMIASYGMPVGAEVFETCVWIGRFIEAWGGPFTKVYRREVKSFLCGDSKAKDGNIRQALIDRYGGSSAIGNKKSPGPLYGITKDVWAALAVAVTWQGTHGRQAA